MADIMAQVREGGIEGDWREREEGGGGGGNRGGVRREREEEGRRGKGE